MTTPQTVTPRVVPTWSPSMRELDDLEVLLRGGYAALRGFAGPDDIAGIEQRGRLDDGTAWPVAITLELPAGIAAQATTAGAVDLLDEEATPIAAMSVEHSWPTSAGVGVSGSVLPLRPLERGSHRALRRTTTQMGARDRVLGVPVRRPVQAAELGVLLTCAAELDARVMLLPLIGHGAPQGIDGIGLVRSCTAARDELARQGRDAVVVPVPVPRHPGSTDEAERLLAALVATAYGATHVPGPLPAHEGLPVIVELPAAVLDARAATPAHAGGEDLPAPVGGFAAPARQGMTVLFTGLSGSGKSTLAKAVHEAIVERTDATVTLLDGDVVRRMLSAELTFSREHRELNVRRIGFVAAEVTRHGGIALCAPIAPYAAVRAEVRAMVQEHGRFVLVHVSTPLEVCESRDRKGLYAKARRGEIPEFTGISDPYDEPVDADLTIDTSSMAIDEAVELVLAVIRP